MKEASKRFSAQKAAKAWIAVMVTNRTNGSLVSGSQASLGQVATLRWDRSGNSTNATTVFCEECSTLALEDQWAVDVTGS